MHTKPYILFVFVLAFLLSACGGAATSAPSTDVPAVTEIPATQPSPDFTPGPPLAGMELIDKVLKAANSGHIAYNAPDTLKMGETVNVQLLLSPTQSAEELQNQIMGSGQIVSAAVEVTPLMKAVLRPADLESFTIQELHDDPVQLILTDEPTEWKWSVTAKKPGEQTVILSLYRLVKYEGQDYWRLVNTYENRIKVTVTLSQRLQAIDWKWLMGILITLLSIPAIWGIFKKDKGESTAKAKGK